MNDHKFSFHGEGGKLFGVLIVNLLLTLLTLGFYYPWAKAAILQYMYKETELAGSRFTFHGTGKEMFKGFLKAIGIFILIYGGFFALSYLKFPIIGVIYLYLGILAILPIAIHGSWKYRLSRSSWKGIHFGYRGDFKHFYKFCLKESLLTLVTLGIYGLWMTINIRKYIIGKSRYGNVSFDYKGKGNEFFGLYIGGYLLTIITLGIYGFWWAKDLINYYYTKIEMDQNGTKIPFKSTITGGGLFKLFFINGLIVFFTLGLGTAWAQVRTMRYMANNLFIGGELDTNAVIQTEEEYKDATGEDLGDMLDLGII